MRDGIGPALSLANLPSMGSATMSGGLSLNSQNYSFQDRQVLYSIKLHVYILQVLLSYY
jgi:hypothetical protein